MVTVERFPSATTWTAPTRSASSAMAGRCTCAGRRAASREAAQHIVWAALLHEIGFTVSHIGFHKHGAYILQHADMPGFSAGEQSRLALLVLGCRGSLDEDAAPALEDADTRAQVVAFGSP